MVNGQLPMVNGWQNGGHGLLAQQLVAGGLVTGKRRVARRGRRPQRPNEDRVPAGAQCQSLFFAIKKRFVKNKPAIKVC
jgi:hypothetical protein